MRAYATRTGTRRNRAALHAAGWGFFLTPDANTLGDWVGPYAVDNGAWKAYNQGTEWQEGPFISLVARLGGGADFVVAPDIVEGGAESLALSLAWLPRLLEQCDRVLLPVQDGMIPADVVPHLSARVGLFVGGSTEWKLANLRRFCAPAVRLGAWAHVGRVNSVRRIRACLAAGASSFDGTSVSRYAKTLPPLDAARRQITAFGVLDDV